MFIFIIIINRNIKYLQYVSVQTISKCDEIKNKSNMEMYGERPYHCGTYIKSVTTRTVFTRVRDIPRRVISTD